MWNSAEYGENHLPDPEKLFPHKPLTSSPSRRGEGDEEVKAEKKRARLPGNMPPQQAFPKVKRWDEREKRTGDWWTVVWSLVNRAARGTGRVFGRANPRSAGVEEMAASGVDR